ncbi:MAG: dihydrodipicolinate synthase family protein [Pseudomonadota bacterium]|nr:dihydrodipicolinate synthase family protein [Pseudomonadota bacterium]
MSNSHGGVYAAPLMPMRDELNADHDKYVAHCQSMLDAGCQGLMPLGSKGEAQSFSIDERIVTMDALAASGLPTERMLIGASALALPDTIQLASHAVSIGAGGVCVQPPFYYKPAEDIGLFDFFSRVINGVGDDRLRL